MAPNLSGSLTEFFPQEIGSEGVSSGGYTGGVKGPILQGEDPENCCSITYKKGNAEGNLPF